MLRRSVEAPTDDPAKTGEAQTAQDTPERRAARTMATLRRHGERTTMTASTSTSSTEESSDGSTESTDSGAVQDVKNMTHTEVVQFADRETDATASEVAAVLREYADALEADGFERFRPGL